MQTLVYNVHLPVVGEHVNISTTDAKYTVSSLEGQSAPYDSAIITNTSTGEQSRIIITRGKWQVEYYNEPHNISFHNPIPVITVPQPVTLPRPVTITIPLSPAVTLPLPRPVTVPAPQPILTMPQQTIPNPLQPLLLPIQQAVIEDDGAIYQSLANIENIQTKTGARGVFIKRKYRGNDIYGYEYYLFTITKGSNALFDINMPYYKAPTRVDLRKRILTNYVYPRGGGAGTGVRVPWQFKGTPLEAGDHILFPQILQRGQNVTQVNIRVGDTGLLEYMNLDITQRQAEKVTDYTGMAKRDKYGELIYRTTVHQHIDREKINYNFVVTNISGKTATILFNDIPANIYSQASTNNPNERKISLRDTGLWIFKKYPEMHAGEHIIFNR